MTHTLNATVYANNTLSGNSVSHVGQMFFDQDLIGLVDAVEPYASNTQEITENSNDSILSEEASDVDPMIEYVLLGDDVSEGVFGWLAFGMDATASSTVSPAANLYAEGGVANANSNMGGGGAPPGGNSTGGAPTGAMPSGAIPSGSATDLAVGSTLTTVVSSSVAAYSATAISSDVSSAAPSKAPQGSKGQSQHGKGEQQQQGQKQSQQQQQQAQKQDSSCSSN